MKTRYVILVMSWAMQIGFASAMVDYPEEIPFVPTPIEVVDRMLELAEVMYLAKADLPSTPGDCPNRGRPRPA